MLFQEAPNLDISYENPEIYKCYKIIHTLKILCSPKKLWLLHVLFASSGLTHCDPPNEGASGWDAGVFTLSDPKHLLFYNTYVVTTRL